MVYRIKHNKAALIYFFILFTDGIQHLMRENKLKNCGETSASLDNNDTWQRFEK